MSAAVANVDIDALKQRLRATWMAGDYDSRQNRWRCPKCL